eukprot:CAMPEP_0117428194 /NCGR_PEP_ID=MMETSP0758-20121206/7963_1 /TAXON_ID=63605 /ORGANISM="Percolomonas cosmopolitus, Strain AE-1 (ATCC 50343)" /LENGTH=213 /DNA_ID=CAMNT_0005214429 /DNA_START=96 /DNA_END=734 /DNA_ORIENTATION=-
MTSPDKNNKFAITTAEAEEIRKQKIIQRNAKKKAKIMSFETDSIEGSESSEVIAIRNATQKLVESEISKSSKPGNSQKVFSQSDLRKAFDLFDRDGSGSIDINELNNVLKSVGHNLDEEKLEAFMKEIDRDGNGTVDFDEFEYVVQVKLEDNIHDEDSMRELFEFFANGESFITENDLLKMMNKVLKCKFSRDDIHDMMLFADRNRDGTITWD